MSLEELTQRATIAFPILATLEDMERLFGYLRQEAGLITTYNLQIRKQIGNEFEEPREHEAAITSDYQLSGTMAVHPSGVIDAVQGISERWDFDCFTEIARDEKPYFSEMKFFTTPGWSLSDYRQETLQLWDQVGELTDKYFELRKPKIE